MAEVDTSIYALPVAPPTTAKQFGDMEQQKLQINQQKLDQANQALTYMTRAMGSLGPNASKNDYLGVAQNAVKMGLVPQEMLNTFAERVSAAPDSPTFYRQFMSSAMDQQGAIAMHTGVQANEGDNSANYQGKRDVITGGFKSATEIALQVPPTQPDVNNDPRSPNYGQPGIVGPRAAPGVRPSAPAQGVVAPSAERVPLPVASPVRAPAASQAVSGPIGPTVQTGHNFDERFAASFPNKVVTGLAPGTAGAIAAVSEQSGKDFASDLTKAKNLQADLYPDLTVLDIVKGKAPGDFGPGTDQLNTLKKLAVTWLPNVDPKLIESSSDYDTVKKLLVQGARAAGNTATNDQLAATFEANPNVTMNTATIESIVKSRVALRKMQAAQTLMAANQNIPEAEYSKWIAKNQNQFDPRAFGVDMMDDKAKEKLYASLKKNPKAFQKFEKTLQFAADAELVGK